MALRSLSFLLAFACLQLVNALSPPELTDILHTATVTAGMVAHLQPRQEAATTLTYEPTTTQTELFPTSESSAEDGPTRTVPALHTASTPIPLAATMGLIMPNPWGSTLYAGVNYSFGFVDPVARPAPTIGGWLRHVQPLLIFPDYTVNVFPGSGHEDPADERSIPFGSQGLCGATAEDYALSYPFMFLEPGWYMYVVNQTWIQPTISSNGTCIHPLVSQKSFFATHVLSIAPRPTMAPLPADPTAAFTVFAEISLTTPTQLPQELSKSTKSQKLAVGFGVAGAVLALAVIALIVWWVRKKHKMERDMLAFSRMSETDRTAFLADNPDHFLNPNRPTARDTAHPPAPPGTLAYAQWYGQQMWYRQNLRWAAGGHGPIYHGGQAAGLQGWNRPQPGAAPGYQGIPAYGQMQRNPNEAVMVYKTY